MLFIYVPEICIKIVIHAASWNLVDFFAWIDL